MLRKGSLVAGQFTDGKYYRCLVEQKEKKQQQQGEEQEDKEKKKEAEEDDEEYRGVFFVDFGNVRGGRREPRTGKKREERRRKGVVWSNKKKRKNRNMKMTMIKRKIQRRKRKMRNIAVCSSSILEMLVKGKRRGEEEWREGGEAGQRENGKRPRTGKR